MGRLTGLAVVRLVLVAGIFGLAAYYLYKGNTGSSPPPAPSLSEKAAALNGKSVIVRGTLKVVSGGPEIGPRLVVQVTSLEESPQKSELGLATVVGTRKGLVVTANGVPIHLNAPSIRFTENDGGGQAVVSGRLEPRPKDDKLPLTVRVEQYSVQKPGPESVTVELRGTLSVHDAAIGGETTGTVLQLAGHKWELDLSVGKGR